MRMPILPRWVLTNPLPAFYDIESTTSVQMNAKLYKYVQSFADDYNKFADEINKAIEEFINEVNSDQECFEAKITKIVHDYIITIDAKIEHQDREIAEAITFIKDNISEGVTQVIEQMKENGELDEVLANSFNEIGDRVNTLETKNINQEERITLLENSLNDTGNRVNTLETKNTNQEERITLLENSKVKMIYDETSESISFENI